MNIDLDHLAPWKFGILILATAAIGTLIGVGAGQEVLAWIERNKTEKK